MSKTNMSTVERMELEAGECVIEAFINELSGVESANCFEYEIRLIKNGAVIDEWDSLYETYNGQGHLSYKNAKGAVWEIVEDVRDGDADSWFDV